MYKDAFGQFRLRMIAPNGKIIIVSEAYTNKAGCMNGIESVKMNALVAEIEDQIRE